MKPSNLIFTALLGALLIGCFSLCGPMEVSAPTRDGPGLERPGESSLVVSGSGSEIVTVKMQQTDGTTQNDVSPERPAPEENNSDLSPQHSELTGYWYGVWAVLLGQVVILMFGRKDDDDK